MQYFYLSAHPVFQNCCGLCKSIKACEQKICQMGGVQELTGDIALSCSHTFQFPFPDSPHSPSPFLASFYPSRLSFQPTNVYLPPVFRFLPPVLRFPSLGSNYMGKLCPSHAVLAELGSVVWWRTCKDTQVEYLTFPCNPFPQYFIFPSSWYPLYSHLFLFSSLFPIY